MRFKNFFALLLAAIIAVCLCGCGESKNYPEPKAEGTSAHDFADVLDQATEDYINAQGKQLKDQTTAEVVVVTVDSLDGEEAAEYALGLGREWGVGDKDKNNGVVILLALEEREIRIEVGYGLEGAIPDSKAGRIRDTYTGYLSKEDYDTGLKGIFNSVTSEAYAEYGITPPTQEAVLPNTQAEEEISVGTIAVSWLILIVLVVLYVLIFGRRGGMFIFAAPRFYGGGGGFKGGGGFGGGSFGGGSFGGGGAGGKF